MKTKLADGVLTLYPEGQVNTNNAPEFEKQVMDAIEAAPDAKVVVDMRALQYISSAGLRVFLKVVRRVKGEVLAINVQDDLYEILEVTGFTDLMDVRKDED